MAIKNEMKKQFENEMELIYVWINKTKNSIFEKQDLSLTSEYNITYRPEEKILIICKNNDYYNLFKSDNVSDNKEVNNIVNISAIVGENGSGKTTILNYILNNSMLIHQINEPGNDVYNKELKDICTSIEVYKYNSSQIKVIHNIEDSIEAKFKVYLEGKEIDANDIIDYNKNTISDTLNKDVYKDSISFVSLTNSFNIDDSGPSYAKNYADKIYLNPEKIKYYSNSFFEMKTLQTDMHLFPKNFNILNRVFTSKNHLEKFQDILNLLYMKKLIATKKTGLFSGKFLEKMKFKCDNYKRILEKHGTTIKGFSLDDEYSSRFEEKLKHWKSLNLNRCDNLVINNLMYNFILELDFVYDILEEIPITTNLSVNESTVDKYFNILIANINLEKLTELTKKVIEKKIRKLYSVKNESKTDEEIKAEVNRIISDQNYKIDEEYEYYKNAIDEINKLGNIIKDLLQKDNGLKINDGGREEWLDCSYYDNQKKYEDFTKFIHASIEKNKSSFVLKYLNINFDDMSSGEKAYLNYFSWLNSLEYFHQINPDAPKGLKPNVILLIDELDLYLHPEWQTTFLEKLLSDLKSILSEHKIQIIFTTHSPIMLSDIPKSNIVFLTKSNDDSQNRTKNMREILNRKDMKDTFGANIFDLFNSSFFLDKIGIVGSFAKKEINSTYQNLKKNHEASERDKFIIESVGEPLVKARLEEISKTKSKKVTFKNNELEDLRELKKELTSSLNKINKLLGENDD